MTDADGLQMASMDSAVGGGPGSLPNGPDGRPFGTYVKDSNERAISWVATRAKRAAAGLDQVQPQLVEMRRYLTFLEDLRARHGGIVGERFKKEKPRVVGGLEVVFLEKYAAVQRFFSEEDKERARLLHEWASDADNILLDIPLSDDEEGAAAATTPSSRASSSRPSSSRTSSSNTMGNNTIRKPPAGHPIWGRDGIMNGLALTGSKGTTVCHNPDLKYDKRSANVMGHNGAAVGSWYPSQLSACWHGVHGSSQGGIHGSKDGGAYSIIVADSYKGLDSDNGNVIWYSGSGSLDNKNPDLAKKTSGNDSLRVSIDQGNPVRVLRKARKGSAWAPPVGLRYDGLYRVTEERPGKNDNGGAYVQFKLERLEEVNGQNQPSLESCLTSPTPKQRDDYSKIKQWF
ncbi:ydg sra domain-containing protein [Colletotrichum sojae]|uniref:Ydg sra domain-containing protein n=1 Tax=Colletotrichum sojae TaxID=2175907 RepID=A0A8H6MRK2_9PEZI|nr:ydg sra domain-containing protein [Colletotrichum sojae]